MLTSDQFNVLVEIERNMEDTAAEFLHMDTEAYAKIKDELRTMNYISDNSITKEGVDALLPYRVRRAVFMAAGFGSRMVPMTLSMPKPLIMVNGKRIIETLLDAVIAAGIDEIYIIRGYQKEAFNMLTDKYPMIKFIDNPDYSKANNISSAYMMRNLMENAYVLESDLVLYNSRIIRKYEYTTNYLGRKTDYTDDWCFKTENGYIKELLVGGNDVSHMYGISFWNSEDARKMSIDIEKVYHGEGGAEKYWDEVSMRDFKQHYNIMVKPVYDGDIIEIDTFEELGDVDERYRI